MSASGAGPLRAVLAALRAGAADLGDVAERTGLDRGVVSAAVAHLIRSGHLRTERLAAGCPPSGCSSCGSLAGDALAETSPPSGPTAPAPAVGCHGGPGASGDAGRGPVLITLARRPST